jgi:hypothetical protein
LICLPAKAIKFKSGCWSWDHQNLTTLALVAASFILMNGIVMILRTVYFNNNNIIIWADKVISIFLMEQ